VQVQVLNNMAFGVTWRTSRRESPSCGEQVVVDAELANGLRREHTCQPKNIINNTTMGEEAW
jgi:hypothetical protein